MASGSFCNGMFSFFLGQSVFLLTEFSIINYWIVLFWDVFFFFLSKCLFLPSFSGRFPTAEGATGPPTTTFWNSNGGPGTAKKIVPDVPAPTPPPPPPPPPKKKLPKYAESQIEIG